MVKSSRKERIKMPNLHTIKALEEEDRLLIALHVSGKESSDPQTYVKRVLDEALELISLIMLNNRLKFLVLPEHIHGWALPHIY